MLAVILAASLYSPYLGTFFNLPSWLPTSVASSRTYGSDDATNLTHRIDPTAIAAVNALFEGWTERCYYFNEGRDNRWDEGYYGPADDMTKVSMFLPSWPGDHPAWGYPEGTNGRAVVTRRFIDYENFVGLATAIGMLGNNEGIDLDAAMHLYRSTWDKTWSDPHNIMISSRQFDALFLGVDHWLPSFSWGPWPSRVSPDDWGRAALTWHNVRRDGAFDWRLADANWKDIGYRAIEEVNFGEPPFHDGIPVSVCARNFIISESTRDVIGCVYSSPATDALAPDSRGVNSNITRRLNPTCCAAIGQALGSLDRSFVHVEASTTYDATTNETVTGTLYVESTPKTFDTYSHAFWFFGDTPDEAGVWLVSEYFGEVVERDFRWTVPLKWNRSPALDIRGTDERHLRAGVSPTWSNIRTEIPHSGEYVVTRDEADIFGVGEFPTNEYYRTFHLEVVYHPPCDIVVDLHRQTFEVRVLEGTTNRLYNTYYVEWDIPEDVTMSILAEYQRSYSWGEPKTFEQILYPGSVTYYPGHSSESRVAATEFWTLRSMHEMWGTAGHPLGYLFDPIPAHSQWPTGWERLVEYCAGDIPSHAPGDNNAASYAYAWNDMRTRSLAILNSVYGGDYKDPTKVIPMTGKDAIDDLESHVMLGPKEELFPWSGEYYNLGKFGPTDPIIERYNFHVINGRVDKVTDEHGEDVGFVWPAEIGKIAFFPRGMAENPYDPRPGLAVEESYGHRFDASMSPWLRVDWDWGALRRE